MAGAELATAHYAGDPKVRTTNITHHHKVQRRLYPGFVDWGYIGLLRPSGGEGGHYGVEKDEEDVEWEGEEEVLDGDRSPPPRIPASRLLRSGL